MWQLPRRATRIYAPSACPYLADCQSLMPWYEALLAGFRSTTLVRGSLFAAICLPLPASLHPTDPLSDRSGPPDRRAQGESNPEQPVEVSFTVLEGSFNDCETAVASTSYHNFHQGFSTSTCWLSISSIGLNSPFSGSSIGLSKLGS
jgi:hypothetical protein